MLSSIRRMSFTVDNFLEKKSMKTLSLTQMQHMVRLALSRNVPHENRERERENTNNKENSQPLANMEAIDSWV